MGSIRQKLMVFSGATVALALVASGVAQAHVVVTPAEVPTASYQTFNVSVPNERDDPTTKLKLVIPAGVDNVTPTVKPGWDIAVSKTKDKSAAVKSITWKNGSIDQGLRDDFTFSAKTADQPVELQWKAYQTYAGGTVVAWDSADSSGHGEGTGPFSLTNVVNETSEDTKTQNNSESTGQNNDNMALYIAIASLVVGLIAVYFATRRQA